MNKKSRLSENVRDAWVKVNAKWKGEDADAFYGEYVTRITEIVDSFENVCQDLESSSNELLSELKTVEMESEEQ